MKKFLALILAVAFVLCFGASALAAGTYTVTVINGMDGSVAETFTVADGEDLVFTISCSAPCDMGPIAAGEAGSGVITTAGSIVYSNVTLGGPNQYPTAETVTISGINADATVTVTPNPDEVGSVFPVISEGAGSGSASGEASGDASDASGEASGASGEPSEEAYPLFDEYKEYLYETMMQDPFWQGNEANLRAGLDAAQSPLDESIQNFTGSGAVDQAPAGVVFPMTYDAWYAENGGGAVVSVEDAFIEYIHEWLIAEDEINDTMTEEIRENEFMPLVYAMDFESFPAEMIYSGMLEQGVPMTFEEFAAQYVPAAGGASGEAGTVAPGTYTDGEHTLVIADDMTFSMEKTGQNLEGAEFVLLVTGTVSPEGEFTITGLFDGDINLIEVASADQVAADLASVQAAFNG